LFFAALSFADKRWSTEIDIHFSEISGESPTINLALSASKYL
jgi:hypothetical protein